MKYYVYRSCEYIETFIEFGIFSFVDSLLNSLFQENKKNQLDNL
ncbi:hypothetical protein HMPREF0766_12873 [Sphingobacterium spiritivorum ATCC 33861]|uniref:Uncharacterized protein n=1 Tax=Sphingobacterium spiritivorum ATCC 33861 TaxID=525373 RepID=D7VPF3_SPHSI|nr:hypothetical protein HMPREF0766_12873 [Sphingobacterium spiritivorum ATCC 33861]